jgi:hypothetical protein
MAVSAATIAGIEDLVVLSPDKNARVCTRRLTFSGNYATGGEAITPADFGVSAFKRVLPHGGVAAAADVATALPVFWNAATGKFVFYEGSAAGTALSEKTNAEAYPTGCFLDVTVIGN